MKLKLRGFKTVDFRKSELTNYQKISKAHGALGAGETYLMVSVSGNQLVWVLGYDSKRGILDTRRWRMWKHSR